eukprot:1155996-Pelagomonas_calceolata.AAC.3
MAAKKGMDFAHVPFSCYCCQRGPDALHPLLWCTKLATLKVLIRVYRTCIVDSPEHGQRRCTADRSGEGVHKPWCLAWRRVDNDGPGAECACSQTVLGYVFEGSSTKNTCQEAGTCQERELLSVKNS